MIEDFLLKIELSILADGQTNFFDELLDHISLQLGHVELRPVHDQK
jgi:hypothetical protein